MPSDLTEGNEPEAATKGTESTTRESERPCLVAYCDVGCSHCCERSCLDALRSSDVAVALVLPELSEGTSQEPQERERNHNKGITTALPWLVVFAESVHGCERVAVPLMVALALVVLELSEGKNQKPQQRERNHNKGIATPLPWLVSVPLMVAVALVGCLNSQRERNRNEGIATPLPCRNSFPKASTVAGTVAVPPMFALVAL